MQLNTLDTYVRTLKGHRNSHRQHKQVCPTYVGTSESKRKRIDCNHTAQPTYVRRSNSDPNKNNCQYEASHTSVKLLHTSETHSTGNNNDCSTINAPTLSPRPKMTKKQTSNVHKITDTHVRTAYYKDYAENKGNNKTDSMYEISPTVEPCHRKKRARLKRKM